MRFAVRVDRSLSIASYAARFQRDFTDALASLPRFALTAVILAATGRGYRPRAELLGGTCADPPLADAAGALDPPDALGHLVSPVDGGPCRTR